MDDDRGEAMDDDRGEAPAPTLLLVDDNETFLSLIESQLRRFYPHATIETCTSGGAALDRLVQGGVDLVLLDYRLPDLDGSEVLAELRARAIDTAVVMATGEGDEQLAADIFRMGAWDYLVKARLEPMALRRCLDGALRRRRLEHQIEAKSDALVQTSRELAERTRSLDTAYETLRKRKDELRGLSESLEVTVAERTAALRSTTDFLNQILDSTATHFIIATDGDGTILTFNRGAELAFGLDTSEVVGRRTMDSLFEPIDGGVLQRTAALELVGRTADGGSFVAHASVDALAGDEGAGFVLVGTDVTHERELEAQNRAYTEQIEQANADLIEKNRQIVEANRLKSEFLANVSHELRTPLNAIIGYTDLMLGGIYGGIEGKQRSAVGGIGTRARDLLELINGILDLARIEAGRMELRVERFELGRVVRDVIETGRVLAKDKDVEVGWVDDGLADLAVRTDERKVQQVLLNLVNNAVKFTPQGAITVRTFLKNGQVTVEVEDTGIGIPDDQQDAVFDEFRQVDGTSTRKFGGTGLGLSISRKFALALGGDLFCRSRPGHGSCFTFRFNPRLVQLDEQAARPFYGSAD